MFTTALEFVIAIGIGFMLLCLAIVWTADWATFMWCTGVIGTMLTCSISIARWHSKPTSLHPRGKT